MFLTGFILFAAATTTVLPTCAMTYLILSFDAKNTTTTINNNKNIVNMTNNNIITVNKNMTIGDKLMPLFTTSTATVYDNIITPYNDTATATTNMTIKSIKLVKTSHTVPPIISTNTTPLFRVVEKGQTSSVSNTFVFIYGFICIYWCFYFLKQKIKDFGIEKIEVMVKPKNKVLKKSGLMDIAFIEKNAIIKKLNAIGKINDVNFKKTSKYYEKSQYILKKKLKNKTNG